jgi:branched-chain amino acid transport system substrate-binding protein
MSTIRAVTRTTAALIIVAIIVVAGIGVGAYYATLPPTGLTTTAAPKTTTATTQPVINIGVIIPLSGTSASTGADEKNAYLMAQQDVNKNGIKSLGGAKINLIFEDSAGDPATGANAATKLITQDHVVALVGAYQSAVTAAVAAVAERQGIPFLNPDSTDPTLTEHGYQWFFRTTPFDTLFVTQFFQFLNDLQSKYSVSLKNVAIVHENTAFGTLVGQLEENASKVFGYNVVVDIAYSSTKSDVTSEVLQLVNSKPDVVLMASYTSDSILFIKTFKQYNFVPKVILGDDAGFVDPSFPTSLGTMANNLFSREVFSPDLTTIGQIASLDSAFNKTYGYHLNGNSARDYVGITVLADALNRAGSLSPSAIRDALVATNLSSSDIPMPWQGVKFDAKHQNTLGGGIIIQWQKGVERTVWPSAFATTSLVFPFPGWT